MQGGLVTVGDVTTTMLWIGNKVTTAKLISYLLIPSLVCVIVPVFIASMLPRLKEIFLPLVDGDEDEVHPRGATMLYLGLSAIVFVPVLKQLLIYPYVGMMFSLAIVATFAEILVLQNQYYFY